MVSGYGWAQGGGGLCIGGASLYVLSRERLYVLDAVTGAVKRELAVMLPTPAAFVLAPGSP